MVVAGFLLDRRGRAGFGGSLLALAACTKVTPILLLPWMVCGRRWRLLGGFLIGLVLWGAVVPGTVLGPASFAAGFGRWWSEMVTPLYSPQEAAPEAPAYVPGQSLRALCHRLLRDVDATAHDEDIVAVNVLALSPGAADGVYLGLSAVLFLGLLACFHRRGRAPAWGARELGVATLATVVFSPLARKAHFVVLFLAATAAFSNARAAHGRQRAAFAAAWGGAFALAVLSSPGALGAWLSKRVMAFCPLTFCALLLAFCLVQRPRPQHRDLNSPARF
jgi:hypothetical protein